MTRRNHSSNSSLELLLDTICNTFGGVLFLAVLIVVLLQNSSPFTQEAAEAARTAVDLAHLEAEFADAHRQLTSLRVIVDQQMTLANQLADPDAQQSLEALHALQQKRANLERQHAELLQQTAGKRIQIEQIELDLQTLDERRTELEQKHQQATARLKREVESRSQPTRLPKLRQTTRQEVQLVVRYGRLYVWHRYDRAGSRIGLNTEEFFVLSQDNSAVRTTPKPYAGTPIQASDEAQRALRSRLSSFRPQRDYLALTVWTDSFSSFQDLKKLMVQLGFEYRLIPSVPGDSYVDRGGSGGLVQ